MHRHRMRKYHTVNDCRRWALAQVEGGSSPAGFVSGRRLLDECFGDLTTAFSSAFEKRAVRFSRADRA